MVVLESTVFSERQIRLNFHFYILFAFVQILKGDLLVETDNITLRLLQPSTYISLTFHHMLESHLWYGRKNNTQQSNTGALVLILVSWLWVMPFYKNIHHALFAMVLWGQNAVIHVKVLKIVNLRNFKKNVIYNFIIIITILLSQPNLLGLLLPRKVILATQFFCTLAFWSAVI